MNGLALCAGIGGMELGLKIALGSAYRCVCYVEREAFSASILMARMEDKALDRAPIWNDVATFKGHRWRGLVDIITAGYPCQPFSTAGKRLGEKDRRHLWPDIARIIDSVQPSLCFLENVPGHIGVGLEQVRADLLRMGYGVSAGLFSAAEVGAPHRRQRLFILAHRDGGGCKVERVGGVSSDGNEGSGGNANGCVPELGNTNGPRLEGRSKPEQESFHQQLAWPPGPEVEPSEWPPNAPEPAVCRDADGSACRVDRLRSLGNSVVPDVAALAFRSLCITSGVMHASR